MDIRGWNTTTTTTTATQRLSQAAKTRCYKLHSALYLWCGEEGASRLSRRYVSYFVWFFGLLFFLSSKAKKKINKLHINLLLFFPTGKKRLTFPHFSVRSFSFHSSHYLFNTLFLSEVPRSSSWFHISVSTLFSRLKGFKGHHTTEHQTMKRSKETNRNLTWLRGPCLLGSSTHWKTH